MPAPLASSAGIGTQVGAAASRTSKLGPPPVPPSRPRRSTVTTVPPPPTNTATNMQGSQPLTAVRSSEISPAEGLIALASRSHRPGATGDPEKEGGGDELLQEEEEEEEGGWRGWVVVMGCFTLAGCQMGYGTCWGVMMQNLSTTKYKTTPLSTLSLVAGLCNFMASIGSFVGGRLGDRYGYKKMIVVNIISCYLVLIISAFVNSLALLFFFQGACLGATFALGWPLFMALPAQWFKKKRGLATGVAVSGSGIGGGMSSLILRAILPKLGFRKALLVYASINFVFSCIAWTLLKVRILPPSAGGPKVQKNWLPKGIFRDGALWSLLGCLFVGTFGFLSPLYLITPYTIKMCPQLDPNSLTPAVPIILMGFAMGFGRILSGVMADKLGPVNSLFWTYFSGGLLQVVFWPWAKNFGSITAFAFLYMFFGSSFLSLMPVAAAKLFGLQGLATITGMAVLSNAPGQFLGGWVEGMVLEKTGGSYPSVAWVSGGIMIAGSLIMLYARFQRAPRLFARY
ncbi:MFS general substrate transporter [Meredithblackwellia eburnea MCA 4105]